ncbi:hypothetical protein FIU87_07340 [Bacillus sp. THAF10]|uniref:hypothetical protein n=1 Tax=Bacillus sp. THAF10 TaxID=2587848 RepID=UPI001268A28C|nr:hypothetical protein [Bacillus sp. THAF10]QFT88453.1 hypothetical protein FIU87_07340 [Bacillus sp. THAF10]
MKASTTLKWITGGLEGFLAIPVIGGLVVMGTGYAPLGIMLILHIITLLLSIKEGQKYHGSIWGIVTSFLAWVFLLGWALHTVTAIILLIDAFSSGGKEKEYQN